MMLGDNWNCGAVGFDGLQDFGTLLRVALYQGVFVVIELARFVEDGVWDGDLADGVERAGPVQLFEWLLIKSELSPDLQGQLGDPFRMPCGPGVFGIDGFDQRFDGALVQAVQFVDQADVVQGDGDFVGDLACPDQKVFQAGWQLAVADGQ